MKADVITSVCILIGSALGSFLIVYLLLKRVTTTLGIWLLFGGLWIVAMSSILLVDVNIPLVESHYYSIGGDRPAPLWVAVLAQSFEYAAIAVVALGQTKLRSVAPIGK